MGALKPGCGIPLRARKGRTDLGTEWVALRWPIVLPKQPKTKLAMKTGMRPIGIVTFGLALAAAPAIAQAQTAVTRQITSEPVETVVTQGPDGTAVTRRILSPEPGVSTFGAPPFAYPPVAAEALGPDYVEPVAPALATSRRVTESRVSTATPARTHTTTTRPATARRVSTRPARTVAAVTVPAASDQALVLSPAQRQMIYRSVVQREAYPAPVPAGPPVVAQTDFYAPPVVSGYPLRTIYPADHAYYGGSGYRDYAYGPAPYWSQDPYRNQDYADPYHTAYRWDGVPLVVGARIPPSVPLVAVPQPVMARIPAIQPYSYAVLDNRVYLVDPATDIIVAEITR
jgi:hypothetical protein